MKKIWLGVVLGVILILLIGALYALNQYPPSEVAHSMDVLDDALRRQMREKVLVPDDESIDGKFVSDMKNPKMSASLVAHSGSFYEFGVGEYGSEGGIEIIAYLNKDGHFEKVWGGQDSPTCASIEAYGVPVEFVPECFKNDTLINRTK